MMLIRMLGALTRLQKGVPGGGIGFITTEDVNTTLSIPDAPDDWTGLDLTEDVLNLNTQKQVNWFLSDAIVNNKENLEKIVWIGEDPPPEGESYIFWFDANRLELLVKFNDQWFHVIPPDQIDMLNETLSGIEDNFTRVRADIALNKIDIDENLLDVTNRINAVESSIPSSDEFYLWW